MNLLLKCSSNEISLQLFNEKKGGGGGGGGGQNKRQNFLWGLHFKVGL